MYKKDSYKIRIDKIYTTAFRGEQVDSLVLGFPLRRHLIYKEWCFFLYFFRYISLNAALPELQELKTESLDLQGEAVVLPAICSIALMNSVLDILGCLLHSKMFKS